MNPATPQDSLLRPDQLTTLSDQDTECSHGQKRPRVDGPDNVHDDEPPAKISKINPDAQTDQVALIVPEQLSELVVVYDNVKPYKETLLTQKLRECDPKGSLLGHYFHQVNIALPDLGPCAADLVWRRALDAIDSNVDDLYLETEELSSGLVRARNLIKHWAFQLPGLDATSANYNVSNKFSRLLQVLEAYSPYGEHFRGIVFVQRRIIVQLLVELIRSLMPGLHFLRPVALVNHRLPLDAMDSILCQFASGHFNLLITTKSFEDLALGKVPVVILYDVFESQVSYANARSCTNGYQSHLIRMVQHDNDSHRHALINMNFNDDMLRWADKIGHDSQGCVPPQQLHESNDPYLSESEDECEDEVYIQDPLTGSKLYKHQATTVLYRFAAINATQTNLKGGILFDYLADNSENDPRCNWTCIIHLPGSPIHGVSGCSFHSKAFARREACYIACRLLYQFGYLDSHIFPLQADLKYQSTEEGDIENDEASRLDRLQPYIPLSPRFWENSLSRHSSFSKLYPFVVFMTAHGGGLEERAPMCILTRSPLPCIRQLELSYIGKPLLFSILRVPPVEFEHSRLELLSIFTTKFCRIIMNKAYECPSRDEMAYFFLPLRRDWKPPSGTDERISLDFDRDVQWETMALVSEKWAVPLSIKENMKTSLEDAIVQDRAVEFTHRNEVTSVREDMTPLSQVDDKPLGYSLLKYAAFASDERFSQGGTTLLEQCHSRRKTFEGLKDPDQPILEVTRMHAAINCLNPRIPFQVDNPAKSIQLLIPEYCYKLTIPASTLRMGYLLPSIMYKIDEILLVKQLNTLILDHRIKEDLLLMATASPLAGNEYDYERLELLGDAFLKYVSTIYVFVENPTGSEGDLHSARQKYISNQNLCDAASKLGLPGYIQLKPFNVRSWSPPGLRPPQNSKPDAKPATENEDVVRSSMDSQVKGGRTKQTKQKGDAISTNLTSKSKSKKRSKKSAASSISNKTVADVAEAIIGAAYISGGQDAGLKATKALMIDINGIEDWSDFDRKALTPHPSTIRNLDASVIASVEQILGHQFQKPHLLAIALMHTVFSSLQMKNHQRFEFIGDAVLDFLVIRYLFHKYQNSSPGDLSALKSIMVSNLSLAAICTSLGLHRFIQTTQQLEQSITSYVTELERQRDVEYTRAKDEGRPRGPYWKNVEGPKVLSDVVESIIGAIFISDHFTLVGVEGLFDRLFKPFYDVHIHMPIPDNT